MLKRVIALFVPLLLFVACQDTAGPYVEPVASFNATGTSSLAPQDFVYVSHFGANLVTVLDRSTNAVARTIPTVSGGERIVVTPDGEYAYISGSDVRVVNLVDNVHVKLIRTPAGPFGIAIAPDASHVYTANWLGSVSVIATASNTLVENIELPTGHPGPTLIAVTPDGDLALVTNSGNEPQPRGGVFVIDLATHTYEQHVSSGCPPSCRSFGIGISPDSKTAYMGTGLGVEIIDVASRSVVGVIPIDLPWGRAASDIEVSPDGSLAYAVFQSHDKVLVLDLESRSTIAEIVVGDYPRDLVLSPDGAFAYTANLGAGDDVSVIETASNTVIATIPVANGPNGITIAPLPLNSPPTADAGPDQTVEGTGPTGTPVTLDGTGSSDPDDDPLTYTWTGPFPEGGGSVTGATADVTLALGEHTITLTVDDGNGETDTDEVKITVEDTTPPVINAVTANPDALWPVDHKMHTVEVRVDFADICDPEASCAIVEVTSNEPDNGLGDGDTENDIQITGPLTVDLRAERSGTGSGRVYTIVVECVDASGNTSQAAVEARVPLSQGKNP